MDDVESKMTKERKIEPSSTQAVMYDLSVPPNHQWQTLSIGLDMRDAS